MSLKSNKQYKCLMFIFIFATCLFICHVLFQNKLIKTPLGLLSLGSPFVPLYDVLSDIITEVYGFTISMRFFWAGNFTFIIFNWLCYFFINLPTVNLDQGNRSYAILLEHAPFVIIFGIIFYILSYRINAYLLVKWKILLKGKYFVLRSIASSLIGLMIFGILFTPVWFWFGIVSSRKEAIQLTLSAIIIRIACYFILAFPSTIIASFLKIIEQVDAYDHGLKFNPFKKEKSMESK